MRSVLTPTRDDLQHYAADQGRFESRILHRRATIPREQNVSRCFWEERSEGHVVNRDSGQPFNLDDPCVFRGGTFGPDPAAYRAALDAVEALVGTSR